MRVHLRNPDRDVELNGPTTVAEVLDELDLNPHTVLVIRDGQLITAGADVGPGDRLEVRPVISGGAGDARCVTCRDPAIIEEPRHRSAWCAPHFVDHVHGQIRKAIDVGGGGSGAAGGTRDGRMFSYGERILVAVSGGKDSLALWDALLTMGYRADGLYLGLGIGGYSRRSADLTRRFAAERQARLIEVDLADEYGYAIPQTSATVARSTCGACGLSKRYVFNREAVRGGYDVVATGHNLDDEAATLLGNVLRWQDAFLARQRPLLPATGPNQPRKVKPLYRLSERETAAYCVVRGIDYVVEECPLVAGNTGMELKEALNALERNAPGTKAQFLFGFLDRHADAFDEAPDEAGGQVQLSACARCGMPTTAGAGPEQRGGGPPVCAFCRQRERIVAVLDEGRDRAGAST